MTVSSPAADIDFTADIRVSEDIRGPSSSGQIEDLGALGCSKTWVPPPILGTSQVGIDGANDPFRVKVIIPNVDTETLHVSLRVYNFKKDVQQLVPLSQIFSVLTRGTSSD
jgi:hypothetical protein